MPGFIETDPFRSWKEENSSLKTAVAETILENQRLKKVWACSSAEVSAYDCRIEIGSIASRSRVSGKRDTSPPGSMMRPGGDVSRLPDTIIL